MVEVKPLTIKVIDCDNGIVPIINTWVNSRPELLSFTIRSDDYIVTDKTTNEEYNIYEYFKKLLKQDSSFMYFSCVTLEVRGSLFLREYLYSFNYLGKWAKTNREKLPSNPCASSEAYSKQDDKLFKLYNEKYSKFVSGEIKDSDEAKSYLPLSTQTVFQMKLSIKELMRIIGYAFNRFGVCNFTKELWSAIVDSDFYFNDFLPLVGKYANYVDPQFPQEIKENHEKMYDEAFGYIQYFNTIGYTLYSHLIRHEGLKVDGYISFMKQYLEGKSERNSRATFPIRVVTFKERWEEIIRIRTAWFALVRDFKDKNNWGWILKDFITGDLDKDMKYLKYFKDGKFDENSIRDYSVDEDLKTRKNNRYQLPNAFALESKAILEQRISEQGMNPLFKDYLEIFNRGYVMDNPNNELRRRYEQNNNRDGSSKR